jgi:hypothetical protein
MAIPRRKTRKDRVQVEGVATRLKDAPPTRYVHGQTGAVRPEKTSTYEIDGIRHRFDGRCHPDCENVR